MIKPEYQEVRSRILQLMWRLGILDLKKGGSLARALGVHNSVIKRLIENKSLPALENLTRICKTTGVSADFILFGKEPPTTSEMELTTYDSCQPAPIDTALISEVVTEAQNYLDKHRLKISPERMGKWIAMLYEHRITEKMKLGEDTLKGYLRRTH
jgi:hypothetical protein